MRRAPWRTPHDGEGVIYRAEAKQHSTLLVMSSGTIDAPVEDTGEIDLRT